MRVKKIEKNKKLKGEKRNSTLQFTYYTSENVFGK